MLKRERERESGVCRVRKMIENVKTEIDRYVRDIERVR